jgi:cytochrome c oxidase subunit 1
MPPSNTGFTPAQKQRWNILGGFQATIRAPVAQRELWTWSALAILSMAMAGVFALLLALSRTPGVEAIFPWPVGFFDKGLVIHVTFLFIAWYVIVFAILVQIATFRISDGTPRLNMLGAWGTGLAMSAFMLIAIAGFSDGNEVTKNDYIPTIIDPLFYGGLIALGSGATLVYVRLLINIPAYQGALEPIGYAAIFGGVIFIAALACIIWAYNLLSGRIVDYAYNQDLFWAGGHVLQYLNTILMLTGWYILGGLSLGKPLVHPRIFKISLWVLTILSIVALAIFKVFQPFEAPFIEAYTNLQYGLALPVVVMLFAGLATIIKSHSQFSWKDPAFVCLVLSVTTFGIGGALGLFVDGADTRTPAHYHGVIAGVNIALMGLFFRFILPLLDRAVKTTKTYFFQIYFYGCGQMLAAAGLFMAGGYGAPRKTAGAAQGLEDLVPIIGLWMNGVGGLIAVIGGIMFIWTIARALIKKPGRN